MYPRSKGSSFNEWVLRKALGVQEPSNPQHAEILTFSREVAVKVSDAIPENNYWAFSAYSVFIPEILSNFTSYVLPQPDSVSITWNESDAVFQGITGVAQLFDQKTHRPLVTKTKGLINIASSIQLATLTGIGVSTLGPLAFAAGTGVCFVLSLDESFRQLRRLFDPVYFALDSFAELDKVENLIDQKEVTLRELKALPERDRNTKTGKYALKLAESTLKKLQDKRQKMQEELEAKIDVALYEEQPTKKKNSLAELLRQCNPQGYEHFRCRKFIQEQLKNRNVPNTVAYHDAKTRDNHTKRLGTLTAAAAVSDSFIWGLAFIGTILICTPGMQPVGLAVLTAASAIFLIKNSGKLLAKVPPITRFFSRRLKPPPAKNETEDEGEENKRGEGERKETEKPPPAL